MQFDEVKKVMIQGVKCHFEDISCFLPNVIATFFKLIKRRFKWQKALISHFLPLERPKFDFGYIEKAIFQVVAND